MDALMRATVRFRNLSNAVPPPKVDPGSCACEGWIEKKITSGPTAGKWRKRYCLLFQEYLYMFRSKDDAMTPSARPTSVITLTGTRVREHFAPVNVNGNTNEESLHIFEIYAESGGSSSNGTKTEAYVGVLTQEDRDRWINAIKKVIYGLRDGGVFGKSLEDNMDYEYRHSRRLIPLVVIQTADFLDAYGLQTEGIFRHAGRSTVVKELKHKYDSGEAPMLNSDTVDVHSVAALLKLYFRELPDPVIPRECYDRVIALSRSLFPHGTDFETLKTTEEMTELVHIITELPKYSYNLLRFMCQFLFKVSQCSAENKMDANNLATVFGPNILKSQNPDPLISLGDSALISFVVSLMIARADFIFKIEYNKQGNRVRTDTLIDLVLDQEDPPPSLIRASGFVSEDDLLDAVSSDDSEKGDVAPPPTGNGEIGETRRTSTESPIHEPPPRRKHSAPPCFTGDMLLKQEPLCTSPDGSPEVYHDNPRASIGLFPKPTPRRKSLSRQSTPPHPTITEFTIDSAEKSSLHRSPADVNSIYGGGDSSQESPITPKPPARNRNKATRDVLRGLAEGSPDSLNDSPRPHSLHLDPKLGPTPDMMHLQVASLKKEIERQRATHEGLVLGFKKQVDELQEKLATREGYYKQEIDTKNQQLKEQENKINLLQEQVSDQQNKLQNLFESLSQKEKENIRLELDLQKMVTKLAAETQANMNLKTELGTLKLAAKSTDSQKDSNSNSTFFS